MSGAPRERTVVLRGSPVHLWEAGEGPPLVFLHGAGSIGQSWVGAFPLLARHARVLLPDLPGFGLSADNPSLGTFRDLAEAFVEFLEKEPGGPFDLVGNSMGGGVATGIALEHPELLRSLVVVAPGGLHRQENIGLEVGRVSPGELNRMLFHRPERVTHEFPKFRPEEVRARWASTRQVLQRWFAGGLEPLPYEKLRVPTLVLWGAEDRILPVAWGREIASQIPHARLAVIEDCGHVPHLELPREFDEAVRAFLATLPTPTIPAAPHAGGGRP